MDDTLITLPTAILAKEKRFNEKTQSYYNCNKNNEYSPFPFNTTDNIEQDHDYWNGNSYITCVAAPTQSLLQRWLREKHNIILVIDYSISSDKQYCSQIYHNGTVYVSTRFITYEEALEAGLIEALNLIP